MTHILLVEDNAADVVLVQEALREHHVEHQLYVVKDGAQALGFIARMGKPGNVRCPDIMLLDLNLPKVTGPQVLRELRSHSDCVDVPVIVVTSSDAQSDRELAAALGVARYFRKPSSFDGFMELGALIREVVESEVTREQDFR